MFSKTLIMLSLVAVSCACSAQDATYEMSKENSWVIDSSKLFRYDGKYIIQNTIHYKNESAVIRLKSDYIKSGDRLEDYKNKNVILIKKGETLQSPDCFITSLIGKYDLLRDKFTVIGRNILAENCEVVFVKKTKEISP